MINNDLPRYVPWGQNSAQVQKLYTTERTTLTLDAKLDPKVPHQYAVAIERELIPPPEPTSNAKSSERKHPQNNDPVSRIFLSIANYEPTYHRIDIKV